MVEKGSLQMMVGKADNHQRQNWADTKEVDIHQRCYSVDSQARCLVGSQHHLWARGSSVAEKDSLNYFERSSSRRQMEVQLDSHHRKM